jgi:hypothetical protein
MSLRLPNSLSWFLAITALATATWAWQQHREILRLRATGGNGKAPAEVQRHLEALQKRKNELEAEVADLRRRLGSIADLEDMQAAADGTAAEAGGRGGNPKNHQTLSPAEHALLTLLQEPDFRQLWMIQQKAQLDGQYGDLLRNLHLPPAEADRFRSLLLDKQVALLDVLAAAQAQDLTGPDARDTIRQLLKASQDTIDTNIRDLLGASDYSQYKYYEKTLAQRGEVTQLEARLLHTSTPLQGYQVDQLTSILAQDAVAQQKAAKAAGTSVVKITVPGTGITGTASSVPISNDAVTRAQGILTTPQLQALQQMQQEQIAQQIIRQLLKDSRRKSQTGGSQSSPGG